MLLMLDALLHATARRELYYCNRPVGAAAASYAALLPKLLLKSLCGACDTGRSCQH